MRRGRGYETRRGRGQQSWRSVAGDSSADPVGADASFIGPVSSSSDRKLYSSSRARGCGSQDDVKHHENITPSNRQGRGGGWSTFGGESYSHGCKARQWRISSNLGSGSGFVENGVSNQGSEDTVASSLNLDRSLIENIDHFPDVSRLSEESEVGKCRSEAKGSESTNLCGNDNSENSKCSIPIECFDICPPKSGSVVTLKPSLLAKNREKRNEMKRYVGGPKGTILRLGMLLLKNYLSSSEQKGNQMLRSSIKLMQSFRSIDSAKAILCRQVF